MRYYTSFCTRFMTSDKWRKIPDCDVILKKEINERVVVSLIRNICYANGGKNKQKPEYVVLLEVQHDDEPDRVFLNCDTFDSICKSFNSSLISSLYQNDSSN